MTRIGASQAFFNIVAQFNAEKLIKDTRSLNTVMKAVSLDTFEAILKPVDDMVMQLDNAINSIKQFGVDLGNATVEFEKFYGEAGNMEQVRDDLIAVGEAYGIVGTEALAAGSRAAQVANLIGRQNIELLVEQAAILAEISDLTHEEAQRGLIQLNQQAGVLYGEMTRQQVMSLSAREQEIILNENAARTLDVLNTVANRSVALEGDLVKTMTNFASGAKLAGDSFEFMAAASATLLEAGEEQGTAGRALRMMYARLGGDINGARSKVEALGFQFTDQNGQMKSMQGILEDLHSKGWSQLNPAMKQNIAQTIAGNRHYVRFIKLMENYERVTQLAADANLRLDSAQQQAERALATNVRSLERAETKVQNLQAAIAEGLTPFMTGQAKAQANYLAATEMLTDGLGDMGEVLGRLMGVFKVTEGFLKFGIALQSISVGMEMFASVQRSLQGVEIAVSNLHSKQSSYKGFNVSMSNEEKDILQGTLHIQQTINRLNKEIQLGKAAMVQDEKILAELAEERMVREARISQRGEEMLLLRDRRNAAIKLGKDLLAAEGDMFRERVARIDYEHKTGLELLQTQKEIYSQKKGAEDAYMRQMLADFEVFGSFNADERAALREKNEDLRKQHTILQQIKAENEAMRVLRAYDEKGQEYTMREGLIQLSKEELAILEQTIQGEQKKTAALIARTERRGEGEGEYMKFLKSQEAQLNALTRGIDFNTGAVELNDTGFKGLMTTIKQVAGAYYQTERAVRTVEAADKDALQVRYQIQNINRQLGTLQRMQKADKYDLIQLTEMEVDASERLLPILRQIQQAEEDSTEQKRLMAQAIEVLTMENKGLGKELKEILALQYQTSKQMQTDMERARAAQKSASIGIANLAGIVLGMGNSTASAMASMAMMSTQIMSAGSAAFKSSRDMVTLQAKIYAVQMDAKLANTRLAAMTGSLAKFFALAKLAAPVLAVGAAFFIIGKNAESARKAIEDLNEATQSTTSTLDRMQATTKIFSDQEGLANALGISNYEMKDLAGNADLTKDLLDKVSNHGLNLSGALEQAALESKQLLQYLYAIQTNARILDEGEFAAGFAALRDEMKGFSGFIEFLQFDTDRAEEIDKFYDLLGLSGRRQEFETGTNYLRVFVRDLEQIMRSGRVLSQQELDLVSAFFGDDEEIMAQIYRLNGLVISGDMARITMEDIARAAEETGSAAAGMATDIENLTQEIYNFSGAREELFFGGQFGNVTGSLYKQVVTQGVGTLYHKNEVIMSNNFHGFFNEREAAAKIIAVLDEYIATGATA